MLHERGVDIWLFTNDRWLTRNPDGEYTAHEQHTIKHDPTIVGDFSGDQVILHATATGAEIQFSCMAVTVSKSLVTDASGHFTATGGCSFV